MCLCLTASWGWGCSCPCLQLGAAAPSSLFAIVLLYNPYMSHSFFLQFSYFLAIPDMINLYLLLSKFNSSQMLEFDDSWKLMAKLFLLCELEIFSHLNLRSLCTDLLATLKNSQLGFLSLAVHFFEIPDVCMVKKIFNTRDYFFLILESRMSPHVMYGSARCKWVLGLSRGKVLHICVCRCTAIHNTHLWVL